MNFASFFSTLFKRSNAAATNIIWGRSAGTASGIVVTPSSAMTISAVYACVRVISETLASLPLILYRRLANGGKERADDQEIYRLMHDQPNPFHTSFIFREVLQAQLCLRGNAYAQIVRNKGRAIVQLIPLDSDRVTPRLIQDGQGNYKLTYEYQPANGEKRIFSQDQILHIQGLSSDGLSGMSVIDLAKESLGLALAEEKHAASFFGNSATPSGIIEHPAKMSEVASKNLRNSFQEQYSGAANAHKVIVLEQGVKFNAVTMSNEQSQFIQSRKFQVNDICRWFRVPPHMIGDLEHATFSNIEHQSLEFVRDSMRPWFVRWEQTLNMALLSATERKQYFFEFLVDALLRGDLKTRYEAHAIARGNGWLNVDEIRTIENMNPLPDGKGQAYLQPLNMQEVGAPAPAPENNGTQAPGDNNQDEE